MTLDVALGYLTRGWSIVPAHTVTDGGRCSCYRDDCGSPGKHPRVRWQPYQERHPSPEDIRGWWRRWPDANVAILTGAISGIIVVDVDPRHGGDDSLRDLGALPDTLSCLTGGGGVHLYYLHPGRNVPNAAGLMPGIDLRGDGGYVLAPPSRHASGREYAWDTELPREPIAVPDRVTALITQRPIGDVAPSSRTFDLEEILRRGIPEGERDVTLTRVAGHYASQGLGADALMMTLRGVNATYCRPPLEDTDVVRIAESIYRRQAEQSRVATAVAERLNGHNGDARDVTAPDDRRAMARQVWAELGIGDVTDWYMLRGDEVEYVLTLAEDEASLGRDLLDQRGVTRAVFNRLGRQLAVVSRDEWPRRAKILRDLAREEVTEEPVAEARVESWIDSFTTAKPPSDPDPDGRSGALRTRAILIDGALHLRAVTLLRYLEAEGEDLSIAELRKLLRRAGWEPRNVRSGETVLKIWAKR